MVQHVLYPLNPKPTLETLPSFLPWLYTWHE